MDPASGFCQGCGRTLAEIARWSGMTTDERLRIMGELAVRNRSTMLSANKPGRAQTG